jgi:hypothetical protein
MSNRKETPDVLGEILGVPGAGDTAALAAELVPAPDAKPRRKAAPQPKRSRQPVKPGAPVAAAPEPPPTWEYREVVFRDYRGWRPMVVDGRARGDWKTAPLLHDYLRQAGDEGWELVSISDRHHNQKEAYFKRRKPAS